MWERLPWEPPGPDTDFWGRKFGSKTLADNEWVARAFCHDLPIDGHKKQILALIRKFPVVFVRGEPGCGKSTRLARQENKKILTFCVAKATPP